MKSLAILAGAAILGFGSIGVAGAQPLSGTPDSPFPHAAPWEIVDGCRTVQERNTGRRIPVECIDETGSVVAVPRQRAPYGAMMNRPMMGEPMMEEPMMEEPMRGSVPYQPALRR